MKYSTTVAIKDGITLTVTLTHDISEGNVFADKFGYDNFIWEGVMDINGTKAQFPVGGEKTVSQSMGPKVLQVVALPSIQALLANNEAQVVSWFFSKKFGQTKNTTIILRDVDLIKIVEDVQNALIDEMHANGEGEAHQSPAQIKTVEAEKEIENAKGIVAKVANPEKLMTFAQIKAWNINYNNVNNEGGEGNIPYQISKEQYQDAITLLEGK